MSLSKTFDPDWFAANAARLWSDWLWLNYRGNVRVIAQVFGVREQTACYWLTQATMPNGRITLGAVVAFPAFREFVEREWGRAA